MDYLKPPYTLILDELRKGKVIPFLGAGASLGNRAPEVKWNRDQATCFPSGNELTQHLAHKTEFPPDESLELTKVAQYYDVVGGRDALEQELHEIFTCDFPLTQLHAFLADLSVPLLIVTTNYDDLIERAFNAKGRAFDVVIHTTDPDVGDRLLWWPHGVAEPEPVNPNKLDIDLGKTSVIYKMHGAVDRRDPTRDQYVITEDDYIDFLTRMTKNRAIPAIFAEPFQARHFLFLGYGLRDWNLRVVLNRIEKDLRRPKSITSWAIQSKPSPLEQEFWDRRGVRVYDIPINEFVEKLQSR